MLSNNNHAVFALLLLVCSNVVSARSASFPNQENSIDVNETPRATASDSYSYMNDFRYMYKVYQECSGQDVTSCLKLKLLAALDRAARTYDLNLVDGVSFVKDPKAALPEEEEPIRTEAEIEANLPRALGEKDEALSGMILNKVGGFLETHNLQIKLPSSADLARAFADGDAQEEGRGRKGGGGGGKKGGGYLLLPLILGGTMVPLALGALALLAGKALIVSKLALVLAGIIGLKKLLAGNSGHHESGHVEVVSAGHHGSGWGRSYDNKEEAAGLAYRAYEPKKDE